jgi:hypothetical protein
VLFYTCISVYAEFVTLTEVRAWIKDFWNREDIVENFSCTACKKPCVAIQFQVKDMPRVESLFWHFRFTWSCTSWFYLKGRCHKILTFLRFTSIPANLPTKSKMLAISCHVVSITVDKFADAVIVKEKE